MLDINVPESYGHEFYFVAGKVRTRKKEKVFPKVNEDSIREAQEQLEMLRPVRDMLHKRFRAVKGFSGIILGKKLSILISDEKLKVRIQRLVEEQYKEYLDIRCIGPLAPLDKKPSFEHKA